MNWIVVGAAIGLTILIIRDVQKNADKIQYVYLTAPTYGSVKAPLLTQIGPITNYQGAPWLVGTYAWTYAMD